MKFKSPIISQGSGSVAGLTMSHNRGGYYLRQRVIPTNPGSVPQAIVRAIVASLTSAWANALTVQQRTSWDTYAENVPLMGPLGEPRNVGGLAMFVRSNVPRLQSSLPAVLDGPTIYNLGDSLPPTIISLTAATDTFSISFDPLEDWANEDDAGMIFYASRGQNQSINYFKGPYRYAGKVEGDAVTPPTSPAAIVDPFAIAVGQRGFLQTRVSRADGRLSNPFRTFDVGV